MGFLTKILKNISGTGELQLSEQLIFDKVIGFRNIVPGCGASTIVHNVALALAADSKRSVCVLDVNMLYPMQYAYLVDVSIAPTGKDIFDFVMAPSEVTDSAKQGGIYVVGFKNRTVVDMMSSHDTEQLIDKLISALKSYFDIILIDLSYELSSIAVHAAVKCNKVFNVADQSLKTMYNLKKSINTMSTMAVPLAKANRVILNKLLPDIVVGGKSALMEAGLNVVGEIPFSLEIAKLGVTGAPIVGNSSVDEGVIKFNDVISIVVEDILQKTPLNTGAVTTNMLIKEAIANNPELEGVSDESSTEAVSEDEDMDSDEIEIV